MRKLKQIIGVVLAIGATACFYTAPPPARDPSVLSPLGVHGRIGVGNNRYEGELLALTETDFVLLTDHVVVIPFRIAGPADFKAIDVGTYGAPWTNHSEQLRLASRFPYGIPASAMAAILKSKGQTAPDTAKLDR